MLCQVSPGVKRQTNTQKPLSGSLYAEDCVSHWCRLMSQMLIRDESTQHVSCTTFHLCVCIKLCTCVYNAWEGCVRREDPLVLTVLASVQQAKQNNRVRKVWALFRYIKNTLLPTLCSFTQFENTFAQSYIYSLLFFSKISAYHTV